MKKAISLSLLATSLLLSLIARSQSPNPLYQHLPSTANHIYSIRIGQIIAKGELMNLLNSMPPPKGADATGAFTIIKDPGAAGIDLSHEILVAQTTASGTGADTVSYTQVLIPLTDSAKFRKTLIGVVQDLHIHHVPGKGATAYQKKNGLAWNDRLVVITTASAQAPKVGETTVQKSLAALAGFAATPWQTDQRFIAGFSSDEDVHAFSTRMDFMQMMGKFVKKMAAKNGAMAGKSFPDYSNTGQMPHPPVLSTFNFENGRIIFRMTVFNKPEDAALVQRELDRPINKDLLARVPNNGVLLGVAAMHINPAAIPDILDKYHTRQMVDSMLGKKGISINDLSAAFGGDFMVAALGDTSATADADMKKKVNFYFAATLGDPAKLMQLATKLAASGNALTDTAGASKMKKMADKMVVQDNILVISGTKEKAQQYFASHDRHSTDLLSDDKSVQSIVIDLKAVSSFMSAAMPSDPKAMLAARVMQRLDRIELDSYLQGENTVMTIQIVTGDPSTNSLKTVVSLLH